MVHFTHKHCHTYKLIETNKVVTGCSRFTGSHRPEQFTSGREADGVCVCVRRVCVYVCVSVLRAGTDRASHGAVT